MEGFTVLIPSKTYRYVLKPGLTGHDVWALQINLNNVGYTLAEDGIFGYYDDHGLALPGDTGHAVKDFQVAKGLVADGIAGAVTQRKLAVVLLKEAEKSENLPVGLTNGLVEGESGWYVGAVNWKVAGGVDCGWVQRRILTPNFTDASFHDAFDGKVQFTALAKDFRDTKDHFYQLPSELSHRRAWELAVLDHNWPAAALNYAKGMSNWTYIARYYFGKGLDGGVHYQSGDSTFEYRSYGMATTAQWVNHIGVDGVSTGHQWSNHYIDNATVYVTDWTT